MILCDFVRFASFSAVLESAASSLCVLHRFGAFCIDFVRFRVFCVVSRKNESGVRTTNLVVMRPVLFHRANGG